MGQRFQSVFILPAVYMNENNPNNRSEKILIFHNQWLYGRGALNVNLSIIKRIKQGISKRRNCGDYGKTKQGYINHFLENSVLNAVKWASLKNLHYETEFHEPQELIYNEEEKKPKQEQRSLKELLRYQDNNNGFFICIINNNLDISYAFLNGFEDAETIKQRTPKEYLNLFYSDEDLKKEDLKLFNYMYKQFNEYNKFKEIPKEFLEDTIKYLNENKGY